MSNQQRIDDLIAVIDRALDSIESAISFHGGAGKVPALDVLQQVVVYAKLVVSSTDGALVAGGAFDNLQNTIGNLPEDPNELAADPENRRNEILSILLLFPVSRGRDVEQSVKNLAAKFQQSAAIRIKKVSSEADSLRVRVDKLQETTSDFQHLIDETITEKKIVLAAESEAWMHEFKGHLEQFRKELDAHRTSITNQLTEQSKNFQEAEADRAKKARVSLEGLGKHLDSLVIESREQVDELVSEISEKSAEAKELVQLTGDYSTAGRFAGDVKMQQRLAWLWQSLTLIFGGAGVVLAYITVFGEHIGQNPSELATQVLLTRVALSLALGGLATYAATQAAMHRQREYGIRDRELDLVAFPAFIASLPPEKRDEEIALMARRAFGEGNGKIRVDGRGPTAASVFLPKKPSETIADSSELS